MISATELRDLLAAPAESVTLDFKELIGWGGSALALVRDITCLANRNGGLLIYGVADRAGRLEPTGLGEGDLMPDPSEIGRKLAKYFDPPPMFEAAEMEVDGRRYGVIQVHEFRRVPHICKTIGHDSTGRTAFAPGDLIRRNDALECAKVTTADGVREMVESSVAKTGAIARGLLEAGTPPQEALGATTERVLESQGAVRACDLMPSGDIDPRAPSELPELLQGATVFTRTGEVIIPRQINIRTMPPSQIIREPTRIVAQTTRRSPEDDLTSVVQVETTLQVRIRERLWEDAGKVDFTSLVAFVAACLLFAYRLYDGAEVARFRIRIGLLAATGHVLVANPARFTPLSYDYVLTSTVDTLATRTLDTAALSTQDARAAIAKDIITELAWYFGFVPGDPAFNAQMTETRRYIPDA